MKQCLLPENPAARKTDSLSRLQCHDSGGPGEGFAPDVLAGKELRESLYRSYFQTADEGPERGLRAGIENVPIIEASGMASRMAREYPDRDRDWIETFEGLCQIPAGSVPERFFPELGKKDFLAVFLRGSGELVSGWKSLVS